jgi:predicted dehydrogenase
LAIDAELHRLQYCDIVDAIRSGRSPQVSGEEGLSSLRIVRSIYESSQTGRDVLL